MRVIKNIILFLLLLLAIAMAVAWNQYQRFLSAPLQIGEQGIIYTVKNGSSLLAIGEDLNEKGISSLPPKYLYYYGRLQNKAHLVKAGEYKIEPNTTFPELLDQLIKGEVIQYTFTLIEGTTAQQFIDAIVADKRFVKTLTNTKLPAVMKVLGYNTHGEGEFQPETYNFTAGTTDVEMLQRAHKMMTATLELEWQNRAKKLPYKTSYEALIMASIIEKESGIAEERPQIAGVFIRRLQKGMRLQTDPTVIYGMGDSYKGNIRRKDLTTDTPYNTYTRSGLPPTPIALPSEEAIHAALHPAQGKSLYFVATGKDGRHYFSKTLVEHNKAVRKYQLKK
jgi:UPF0755 protein